MCGIVGLLRVSDRGDAVDLAGALARMNDSLAHRGPDGEGVWIDQEAGVALGQRRLAIIDLSEAGHQPMISADGRFVISFNGEIYNAEELRARLPGLVWRGHSDTEVLLETIARYGLAETLARLNGMFAIALWDRRQRCLTLARDHLGIKPLYVGQLGGTVLVASELKAMVSAGLGRFTLSLEALAGYFRFQYVPSPHSIYAEATKLRPGTWLRIHSDGRRVEQTYWSLSAAARAGMAHPVTETEALREGEALLRDAVARQLVADVPVGVLLSGGIDSSMVAALAQSQRAEPIRTFSIGFADRAFNEAHHAGAIARHLGTEHHELYVTEQHALEVVPLLCEIYDEPFADASQIPTFLVSKLTREHVTVALSGDGGDELFAGYNRYYWATALWQTLGWCPVGLRRLLGAGLTSIPPQVWDPLLGHLPAVGRYPQPGDKLHKLAALLDATSEVELYRRLVSHVQQPLALIEGGCEPITEMTDPALRAAVRDTTSWMQLVDGLTYLPDDILTKVDRASMAVSLETRVPLLDHRLAEWVWRLPPDLKVRGRQGKWLLRLLLDRYVPRPLLDRPKMGFGVPLAAWLRGPLKPWAEEQLGPVFRGQHPLIQAGPVVAFWQQHQAGRRNWSEQLWSVLMFCAWEARWR